MPINSPQSNLLQRAIAPKWLPRTSTNFNGQEPANSSSIFYINDVHGKSINIERAVTASNAFDKFVSSNTDVLKLSSGDIQ